MRSSWGQVTSLLISAPAAERQREVDLSLLAKALGHPVRVRILRLLLSREDCYCGQIVDELPLAQATVSQHLKVLKDAGLIKGETDGPRTCYCASRERLAEFEGLVGGLTAEASELSVVRRRGCD
jgi:ArsR family transcriptional regulator